MGLIDRLLGRPLSVAPSLPEPKRLLPASDSPRGLAGEVKNVPVREKKASSFALLPRGAYGSAHEFFSPDGGRTIIDLSDGPTIFAFVAYWHVATRWKAQKLAEAPLMVVQEDQETGDEEWMPDHELVPMLEEPSPDYDMGELLECTSQYLDNTGSAIWTIDKNKNQEIVRITPFSRNQFETLEGTDEYGLGRLYATFDVHQRNGTTERYLAEDVCFFRDSYGSATWGRGRSRLDIAMSWLKLGLRAQQTIYDLLSNSVWPSLVLVPDKDWDPDEELYEQYKMDVENYARAGAKGKPFIMLGGGDAKQMQASIKDLVPDEVLNRVESVVAAVSGVPAIVLQFEVGLQNSPWSQMGEARKMAYDDTIEPLWKKVERTTTRQILRPYDEDVTLYLRFDRSNISSLANDQLEAAQIATTVGRAATLNERRAMMGLEPATKKQDPDGKADQIPELTQPSLQDILAGNGGKPTDGSSSDSEDPTAPKDPAQEQDSEDPPKKRFSARQFKAAALLSAFREEQQAVWKITSHHQLQVDRDTIADLVETMLTPATQKSRESKVRGKDRVMSGIARYLNEDGKKRWTKAINPVALRSAQRAGAVASAELGVNYNLIHNQLTSFAAKQTKTLIVGVNKTTQSLVNDIVQGGLDANASNKEIAKLIRDATGFDISRAELIARTETTRAFNGAPAESLAALSKSTGVIYTKTWSGVLDDRERDEHVEMEGETVKIDESFSNGLDYPSEPNCRCTLLFAEAEED